MERSNIAHKISSQKRTSDVLLSENVDFAGLLLSEPILKGLQVSGFERPSPIQLKAIPLGRCGLDLIVQAKSGTGKTCVFSVIALESLELASPALQVLVLAPTREIAVQIQDVVKNIGSCMPQLVCHTFIGGLPVREDINKLKKCHIAIGSPGRVKQLIESGLMKTDSIRMFILDEADKLLEESFQEQINWIYSSLPDNKQILALSATYPDYLANHLQAYMRNPTFIRLNVSDPALLGIKQYYTKVPYHPLPNKDLETKTKVVIEILSSVTFKQCLIFSNFQTRAQNLCNDLQVRGWPTSCIAGSLDQKERLAAMNQLKTYQCRVLISTDLTSRGIDADKVDLVINLDVPYDHETYLHRIGRAGRFGSFGAAVSIVSEGKEETELKAVERKCNTNILPLPDPLPVDLVKREIQINIDDIITTEKIATESSTGRGNVLKNDLKLPENSSIKSQDDHHGEENAVKCDNSYKYESSYQNGHFNEMKIGEKRSENDSYRIKGNKNVTQIDSDLSQSESLKEVNKSNNCLVEADIKSNTGSKTKQVFKKMAARNVHQSISSSDSGSSDDEDEEDDDDDDEEEEQTDAIKPSGQKFIINGVIGNENPTSEDMNTGLDGNDGLSKEEMDFTPTAGRKGYTKEVSYQKTQKNRNRKSNAVRRNHKDKDSVEIDVSDKEKTEETKPKISEFLKSSHEENRADGERWNEAPGMPMEEAQYGKLRTANVLSDKQRILQSCQDVFSSVQNLNFRIQHPLKHDSKIKHGTEQTTRFENSLSLEKEVHDVNCSNNICENSTDKSPYMPDKKDILKMSSSIQTVNDILKTNSDSQTVDNTKTNSNIKTVDYIFKTNISMQSVDCADKNILQMSNDVQTVDNILKTSSNSQTVDDHRSSYKGKSVTENRSGSETKFVNVKPFSDLEIGMNSLEISETSKSNYDVLENSARVCKSSVNGSEKNSATSSDNAVTSGKPKVNLCETSAALSNTSLSSDKPDKTKVDLSETSATPDDATIMHDKLGENTKTHLGENSATVGETRASLTESSAKVGDSKPSLIESSAKVGDNRASSREGATIGDTKAISKETSAALSETKASSRDTSAALCSNRANPRDTSAALCSNRASSKDTSVALGDARISSKGGSDILGETRTRLIETSAALCDTTFNYDIPGDNTNTNSNLSSAKSYNSVKTGESNALPRPQSDEISEINHNQQPGKPNKLKPQQVDYASAVERYKQCQSTEDWKDYDYMAKICEQMKSGSSSLSVELCEDMLKEVDEIYASFGKHKLSFLETNAQGTQTDAIFENISLSANNNHAQSEMKDAEIYEIGKFKCDNSDGAFNSQECDLSDPPFAQSANKHNFLTASDARGKDPLDSEESQPFNNPQTLVQKHMEICSLDVIDSEEIRPFTNPPTFVQKQMKRYSVESANKPVDSDLLLRIGRKTIGTKDKNPKSLEMDMDVPESGCPNSSLRDIRPSLAKVSISTQNGVATLSDLEDSSAVCHQEVLPPESDSEILESSSSSCLSSDSDPTPSSDEDADNRSGNLATGYEHCYWNHAYLHHNMQWPYMDKRKKSVRKAHEDYVTSSGHNYPPYMASTKDHAIRYPCYRTRTTSTTSSKHQPKTSKQSKTPNKEEGSHGHSKTTNSRSRKYDSSKYGNYAYSYPSSFDMNSYHNWYINHWLPWYHCQSYWQQPSWYPYGLYPYNNHLFRPEMINTADGSVNNMEKLAKIQQDYIRMMSLK